MITQTTTGNQSEQQNPAGPEQTQAQSDYNDLAILRKQYLDYATVKRAEIEEQREARHYYHNDHWSPAEVKALKKRKQPVVTFNRISRKIDGVVGLVERLKQDPKAYPRTPKHEDGADIASATLRYSLDACEWQSKASEAARQAAMIGIGGVELIIEQGDHGDPEPALELVDGDTYFYDPRSFRQDFSDKRFDGVAKWMDIEAAQEMFPDKAQEISGLMTAGSSELSAYAQQDRERKWIDTGKKRIFVVEHWYKKGGKWLYCFYTAGLKLAEGESPFKDERGKSASKFLMFSANVDHDGDRYGFVRNLKSAQDELNHRRSKSLHALNSRRIIARNGSLANPEKTRAEAARPDGMILWDVEKPEFDDNRQMADMKGQMEFAANAATEIENFGPNPAVLGQGVENSSGRAIQLLQQAGIAELGPFIIALRNWKLRVYRAMWNAIQEHWTSERWIRVTDNDGLAQFIQVNQLDGSNPHLGPQIVNSLGSLDVDIILDEGPDTITTQQEALDTLVQGLAQNGVPVPPEVLIKLTQLPSDVKKEVLTAFEQQAQKPDPKIAEGQAKLQLEQQKAQINAQTQMQSVQAEIELARQKAAIDAEQAQQKAMIDAQIARQKAEDEIALKRMIAEADIQLEREKAAAQIEIEQMKANAGIAINRETAQAKVAQGATQES